MLTINRSTGFAPIVNLRITQVTKDANGHYYCPHTENDGSKSRFGAPQVKVQVKVWGVPWSRSGSRSGSGGWGCPWGTPLSWGWHPQGTPLTWGVPPTQMWTKMLDKNVGQKCWKKIWKLLEAGGAGGTPLAVTQKDCLVILGNLADITKSKKRDTSGPGKGLVSPKNYE